MSSTALFRLSVAALFMMLTTVGAPALYADEAVHGDDGADTYVGTGGLILPSSIDEGVRREVASCAGCAWRVTTPCAATDLGAPLDDGCRSVVRGCPGGQLRRTWFQPADGPWRETGLVCIRKATLWTVSDAGQAARDRLARAVPALGPITSPPRGVLTQLPTHFSAGMPGGQQTFTMTVAGHELVVHALPSWTWSFGDGASAQTDDPGGAYPQRGVTHTYRVAGRYRVTCTTAWSAEFWSDGLGPFPVPETIRQQASVDLVVGDGRAVLIPGEGHSDVRGTMGDRLARPS